MNKCKWTSRNVFDILIYDTSCGAIVCILEHSICPKCGKEIDKGDVK